jgi:nucleotide-binding universal stress UspA family protein
MRLLASVNIRDEEADRVVDAAATWAERGGNATVDLLFVDSVQPVPAWVNDPLSAQVLQSSWAEARQHEDRRLDELLARIPEPARGKAVRVDGPPADEILHRAIGYEAVILAGRRHSALGRVLLGSVAARVARLSPVPVIVVPGGVAQPPVHGPLRILFGVDLRAADVGTGLERAKSWAARLRATLDLAHVDAAHLHVPYILDPDVRKGFEADWQALRRQDLERLRQMLDGVPAINRGQPRLEDGEAAGGIADLARDYDLVAVATHGRTGIERLYLGSVGERLIQLSERPVLLLRATPT